MQHRIMQMFINFLANHVCTSVKTVYTKLLAKNSKLHKLATTVVLKKKKRLLQTCISFFSKIVKVIVTYAHNLLYLGLQLFSNMIILNRL